MSDSVSLDTLMLADSPRLDGEDPKHVELLAVAGAPLPPVLVHRSTMRVIDGIHRILAARLRGDSEIAVTYFEGTDFEAFVRSVQSNVQHGLPLTRADREAAVLRILESQAAWSDRAIAEVTGLSAPTVGAIRSRATDNSSQSQARIGKDGRIRPLTTAEGRRAAAKIIAERPDAPLREIASTAGISMGTARDVRDRLQRGDDPVPIKYSKDKVPPEPPRQDSAAGPDLQGLRKDPSLRFNAVARTLLQWLSICDINDDQRNNLIQSVPEYRRDNFAELALVCAERWRNLAKELRQPNRDTG
ncbi:streptomycin biosynthesis protein [Amycolatopsis sp. NPDC051071]|uniref:ParB/RepB/Spo0J family partition protein n=1 Tax=Amycolatopsis sp. NPDC051071 TaxID=3154637 RepID=UPI003417058E